MNRLDSILSQRAARGRTPLLRKILFFCVGPTLVLSALVLPPTTAQAAAQLSYLCPPEPSVARPRVQATGEDLNGGELVPGDEIIWTITVKNLGGTTLKEIILTDIVPEWTSYVGASIEGSGADDSGIPTLTWAVGALECGDRVTVSFRSRVDDGVPGGTLITNQASADSAQTPPGVSKTVSMEVAGKFAVSSAGLSPSSSPTTVLEGAAGDGTSAQTTSTSEAAAEAALGSSQTTLEGTVGEGPQLSHRCGCRRWGRRMEAWRRTGSGPRKPGPDRRYRRAAGSAAQAAVWGLAPPTKSAWRTRAILRDMNASASSPAGSRLARAGAWLVGGTLAYNVIEAGIALWAGTEAGSIALLGFGVDSLIEVAAAGVLLWRLLVEARSEDSERVERAERRVHRFIGLTFLLLATYVVTQSVITLATVDPPRESLVGIVLAAASLVVMPLISWGKLRVARRLQSEALRAKRGRPWRVRISLWPSCSACC